MYGCIMFPSVIDMYGCIMFPSFTLRLREPIGAPFHTDKVARKTRESVDYSKKISYEEAIAGTSCYNLTYIRQL